MNNSKIEVVEAEFTREEHRQAIPFLLNEYAKDLLGLRQVLDNQVLKELVPGLEKVSNAIVLLARIDQKYVGMAICFLGFSTFQARPIINIHDFMVLKEYRNNSIGTKLLQKIELIAKRLHCCKITLEVQENNTPARKLYHSFGFKDSFLNAEAGSQLFLTKEL